MQEHEEVGQSLSGTEPANYTLARHVACQIRGNLVQCQSVMFSHSCWQTEFYRKCVKSGKKRKFNMQHELQTAHLISIFIYNSIGLALRHCDTRISPPKIGHFSQFLIY